MIYMTNLCMDMMQIYVLKTNAFSLNGAKRELQFIK